MTGKDIIIMYGMATLVSLILTGLAIWGICLIVKSVFFGA